MARVPTLSRRRGTTAPGSLGFPLRVRRRWSFPPAGVPRCWRWSLPSSWLWLALLVGVAIPIPVTLKGFEAVGPETAWPLIWVLVAASGMLIAQLARASWPLALGFGYVIYRTWWTGFPQRSLEVLALTVCGVLLYLAALRVPRSLEAWAARVILAGAGINAALGLWNLTARLRPERWQLVTHLEVIVRGQRHWVELPWGPLSFQHPAYPFQLVREGFLGLPTGLFPHPNEFGLFLALVLPLIAWAVGRAWLRWGLVGLGGALVGLSQSRIALVAVVVMALCRLRPAGRWLAAGGTALAAALGGAVLWGGPATTLGGRLPVWWAAWDWLWERNPVWGIGWGLWKVWALWPNGPVWTGSPRHGLPGQARMSAWWTEAQGEPMQLVFELGIVGLAVGLWWAISAGREGWGVFRHGDGLGRAWVLVLIGAGVCLWMAPVFRTPQTAVLVLFALGRVRARARTG